MRQPVSLEDDDAELARRIAAAAPDRDDAAEAELCRRFVPRIRFYGLRHLRNEAAAADLVQDVLLMILQKLRAREVREPERLASFILGTCRQVVIDGRRGELEGERETELEEHLFGCEACSARLRDLARLGEGIGHAMRAGHVPAVLTATFIRRLQASGMRVREYRLQPGGSVNCTVAPDDDLVIAHLHAPLGGVQRLDLLFDDVTSGAHWRVEDVAFDASAEEVVLLPDVAELRQVTVSTQRVQLLAVELATERVIADYTFNHSRYQA